MRFLTKIFRSKKDYFRLGISTADKEIFTKKWSEIQELIKLGNPSRFKTGVIEADKLLYFILDKMRYSGSLSEKLKKSKDRFVNDNDYSVYNDVWLAHKCRNEIIHEFSHEILSHEAIDTIQKFENGFRKLGVL
jgi:hypothetical protein